MSKTKPTSREKSLDDYLSLSYPYELVRDEDGSFVASHPGLIGCLAQGGTADEAVGALDLARRAWIEVRFEEGLPIPEPLEDADYSGKILLRIPPALHAALARLAEQQGASLNQLINNLLSQAVGSARGEAETVARVLKAIERLESRLASRGMPIELGELGATVPVPQKRTPVRKKSSH
jgi:predicted RNase H-like HicB family nuclease